MNSTAERTTKQLSEQINNFGKQHLGKNVGGSWAFGLGCQGTVCLYQA